MLTVLVRLGLRAKEVTRLRLDDISWRAGGLVVNGKGNRREQLPLPVASTTLKDPLLAQGRNRGDPPQQSAEM